MTKTKERSRPAVDESKQRLVEKAVKIIRYATYGLAAGIAAFGAWWFTIPGGGIVGAVLLLAALLISVFATIELRVRKHE